MDTILKNKYMLELLTRYPALQKIQTSIAEAYFLLLTTYKDKGKLLVAGNGGSAADADHIVGELMKGFIKNRQIPTPLAQSLVEIDAERGTILSGKLQQALPCIALTNHNALTTATINDNGDDLNMAQQLMGFGAKNDTLLAISTSGNSSNVVNAAITAKALGMSVIGLTGQDGGVLRQFSAVQVQVPETECYKIQELHLPIYHAWCLMLEDHFFS